MKPFVTKLEVRTPEAGKYLDWLARLMMQGVESAGALSGEISFAKEWVLVQQFSTQELIEAWLSSAERKKLMTELAPDLGSGKVALSEGLDPNYGFASVAVVTQVKKGQERDYFALESKYQAAQARTAGYRGAYVQHKGGNWTTLIRFDSPEAMEKWFSSEERKKLVAAADHLVKSTAFHTVATSFPGWFPAEAPGEGPPNWKTALLILLGLYPSVMLVILFLLPLLKGYPLAVNNFIGNIITVAITTWVTMPLFIKLYKAWLFPTQSTPPWVDWVSLGSLIIFFALEIGGFLIWT